jgi:phage repressor protein C with HTH and peptisase S24 domain
VPLIGFAQAGGEGYFDDGGYPVGGGWDEVSLPEIGDANAYALEISGDSMEPVFRDGDMVIVSPAAPIRRGDRVVVRTTGGEVMAKHLARRSARRVELRSLNPEHPDYSFDLGEITWIHRIVWASQ